MFKKSLVSSIVQTDGIISDAEEKLETMIGLSGVKTQVRKFIKYYLNNINDKKNINLHMVFSGNPGTGKTTVARLIGEILFKNGILPTRNFVEGSRDTLVAEYIGHTSIKTNAAIQKAMGGVLFIDEAYTLNSGGPNDFGKEAIDELIKAMEDHKGEFCLILAGYSDEMEKLFSLNSGLKSRIQKNVLFEDYSNEELLKILNLQLAKAKYKMSQDDKIKLIDFIGDKRNYKNFANAREVRIALEQLTMIQAERTIDNIENRTISQKDLDIYFNENKKFKDSKQEYTKMIEYKKLDSLSKSLTYKFKDNYLDIIESIISIRCFQNENQSESSGFLISPDGYAITCAHCVKDVTNIIVRRRFIDRKGNTVESYHEASNAAIDETSDTAIIKLNVDKSNFSYLPLAKENYLCNALTDIIEIGYPLGQSTFDNLSMNKGYITSIQKISGINNYLVDIKALKGSSGSCLLELQSMKVVGIIHGKYSNNNVDEGVIIAGTSNDIWKLVRGIKND